MAVIQDSFEKDPKEILDYKWSWAAKTGGSIADPDVDDWLASGEIITDYVVSASFVPGSSGSSGSLISVLDYGLTDGNTAVVAWLGGGDLYCQYYVGCTITTSNSPTARVGDRKILIKMVNK